jgi:hypothetical protein
MNALRAVSTEGFGRWRYYREIRRRLDGDPQFRPYFEQSTSKLPQFYVDLLRKVLGPLWDWLPQGGVFHDPCAYLESVGGRAVALDGALAGRVENASAVPVA